MYTNDYDDDQECCQTWYSINLRVHEYLIQNVTQHG